jgi:hypothetical protein
MDRGTRKWLYCTLYHCIIDRLLTVRVMSIGRGTVEPFIKVVTKLDVKEL